MERIYLDANGASPALPEARNRIIEVLDFCGNPSSSHEHGRFLRTFIDEARSRVALAINASEKEVIFTSGASESNRLFVDSLLNLSREKLRPLKVVMSPYEHPSLFKPVMQASLMGIFSLDLLKLDDKGHVRIDSETLKNADVLVVCQAHNETGILPDLIALLDECSSHTLVMSDVSQGFARLDPVPKRVDILTCSAQKMGGFPGVGAMVIRGRGKTLKPPWFGGGQERGFRPGTESALLIAAFGEAARHVAGEREKHRKLGVVRDYFEQNLETLAPIKVIGKDVPRLCNTSAISFIKENPDALRIACDRAGLSVGFGAACSGLAPEGSFALKELSLSLAEEKSTVRFSLTSTTTLSDMDETLKRLVELVLTKR